MTTANTNTATQTNSTEVNYEISKFALNVGIGMAALIGIWGAACMIGGLAANGAVGMAAGFLGAVMGV